MKRFAAHFTTVTRTIEHHTVYVNAETQDQAEELAIEADFNVDTKTKTIDNDVMNSELNTIELIKEFY